MEKRHNLSLKMPKASKTKVFHRQNAVGNISKFQRVWAVKDNSQDGGELTEDSVPSCDKSTV